MNGVQQLVIPMVSVLCGQLSFGQRIIPVSEVTGGNIQVLHVQDDLLYLGGQFNTFNGHTRRNLQSWDGTIHNDVGDAFGAMDHWISALETWNGQLIAGGRDPDFGHIGRWDGASWHVLDAGFSGPVRTLAVWNGELYAAGSFTHAGSATMGYIARWNGSAWADLAGGLNGVVNTLAVHEDQLFVGGEFTATADGNMDLEHLATWTGSNWAPLADGLNGPVRSALPHTDGLYIGGDFTHTTNGTELLGGVCRLAQGELTALALPEWVTTPIGLITDHTDRPIISYGAASLVLMGELWHPSAYRELRASTVFGEHKYVCGSPEGYSHSMVHLGTRGGFGRWTDGRDHAILGTENTPTLFHASELLFHAPMDVLSSFSWGTSPEHRVFISATRGQQPRITASTTEYMEVVWACGPMADQVDDDFLDAYQQVWHVEQALIDQHLDQWDQPGYVVPEALSTWPGNGNVDNGEPLILAPFNDFNGNGLYEPELGEHPQLLGHEMVYWIMNDGPQLFPEGEGLGVDVHFTAYRFEVTDSSDLGRSIFLNIRVVDRIDTDIEALQLGLWSWPASGSSDDLLLGNDTLLDMKFHFDGGGMAVAFLDADMSHAMGYVYVEPSSPIGPPTSPLDVASYMQATWKDGTPLRTGGIGYWPDPGPENIVTKHLFAGDPISDQGWTSAGTFLPPWRVFACQQPFDMEAGDQHCSNLVFTHAGSDAVAPQAALLDLRDQIITIREEWVTLRPTDCNSPMGTTQPMELGNGDLIIWPNPADRLVHLHAPRSKGIVELQIMDLTGRHLVWERRTVEEETMVLPITDLPHGVYQVLVTQREMRWSGRLLVVH